MPGTMERKDLRPSVRVPGSLGSVAVGTGVGGDEGSEGKSGWVGGADMVRGGWAGWVTPCGAGLE